MGRSRRSAKTAGSTFERMVATYLAVQLGDDRIDRRVRNGVRDRGDIGGLTHLGQRVVVECKDYGGRVLVGPWLAEVDVERGHDDAGVGLVVAKRRGTRDPGEQVVLLSLRDLVALLTGARPGG